MSGTSTPLPLSDLRPLSLGELLDHSFLLYRRHFSLFLGISVIPHLVLVLLNIGLLGFINPWVGMNPRQTRGGPGTVVAGAGAALSGLSGVLLIVVCIWLAYSLLLGATTFAVSDLHMGRPATARGSYRRVFPRTLRLFDVVISVLIRVWAFFLILIIAAAIVGALSMVANVVLGGVVYFASFLGVFVLTARSFLGYSLSIPSLLIENLRARQAMKRSRELTRGRLSGIFLIFLLMGLVMVVIAGIVQGPAQAALIILSAKEEPPRWLMNLSVVLRGVGQMLAGPLMTIALVLYYYDMRVRKEGFDLQTKIEALDALPARNVPPGTLPEPGTPPAFLPPGAGS
jgi:hypothetical protein